MSIRVLLVDDQALLRTGFRMILQAQPDLEVVGEAVDGADAVRQVAALRPDVVLMDVRMPVMDGVQATAAIAAGERRREVLVLTTFDVDEYAFAALRAGASGFLLKDVPPPSWPARSGRSPPVTRSCRRGSPVDCSTVSRCTRRGPSRTPGGGAVLGVLTDRERQVLGEVAKGLSNAEIAGRLHLSEATVKTHITRVLAKLQLRDRVQVVIFAYEHDLLDDR